MVFTGHVEFFNDSTNKLEQTHIFICADTFNDALEKITAWYGEKALDGVLLRAFSPDDFLEFKHENYKLFQEVKEKLEENIIW